MCPFCNFSCKKEWYLKKHIGHHHRESGENEIVDVTSDATSSIKSFVKSSIKSSTKSWRKSSAKSAIKSAGKSFAKSSGISSANSSAKSSSKTTVESFDPSDFASFQQSSQSVAVSELNRMRSRKRVSGEGSNQFASKRYDRYGDTYVPFSIGEDDAYGSADTMGGGWSWATAASTDLVAMETDNKDNEMYKQDSKEEDEEEELPSPSYRFIFAFVFSI